MSSKFRQQLVFLLSIGISALTLWVAFHPEQWKLALLYLFSIPSNSFIPIPHEPGLLYFSGFLPVLPVSLTGVAGACVAGCIDYFALSWFLSLSRLKPMTRHYSYQFAIQSFSKFPFLTVLLFSLLPLPYYPIRVLAAGSRYPLPKYLTALALGKWPRYYIVALTGAYLKIPPIWLYVIGLFFLLSLLVYAKRLQNSPPPFSARSRGDD